MDQGAIPHTRTSPTLPATEKPAAPRGKHGLPAPPPVNEAAAPALSEIADDGRSSTGRPSRRRRSGKRKVRKADGKRRASRRERRASQSPPVEQGHTDQPKKSEPKKARSSWSVWGRRSRIITGVLLGIGIFILTLLNILSIEDVPPDVSLVPAALGGCVLAALWALPGVAPATAEQRAAMSHEALLATQSSELKAVMGPYVALGLLYILLAVMIGRVKVTERPVESAAGESGGPGRLMRLLRNKRYSFGVVAQYFNVSAQTCIWTYTLHYVTSALGVSDEVAGYWLQASLIVFLVFRFLMVGLMGRYDARKLLLLMCSLGVALSLFAMVSVNILGVLAIISLSACISLLFPTIYGEALMGLGEDTKYGAAGLVMAIIGGATMPLVQSAIMDHTSPAVSYVTVAGCFLVVAAYGLYTLRAPRPISAA